MGGDWPGLNTYIAGSCVSAQGVRWVAGMHMRMHSGSELCRDNDQSIMDRDPAGWTAGDLTPPFGETGEIASLLLVAAVPTGPRRKCRATPRRLASSCEPSPNHQSDQSRDTSR